MNNLKLETEHLKKVADSHARLSFLLETAMRLVQCNDESDLTYFAWLEARKESVIICNLLNDNHE